MSWQIFFCVHIVFKVWMWNSLYPLPVIDKRSVFWGALLHLWDWSRQLLAFSCGKLQLSFHCGGCTLLSYLVFLGLAHCFRISENPDHFSFQLLPHHWIPMINCWINDQRSHKLQLLEENITNLFLLLYIMSVVSFEDTGLTSLYGCARLSFVNDIQFDCMKNTMSTIEIRNSWYRQKRLFDSIIWLTKRNEKRLK